MKYLRTADTRNVIAFIAGLAFFNLGLIQFELTVLDMSDYKSAFQNVVNNSFEEETESGAQSSEEDASKEALEFALNHHEIWECDYSFATKRTNPFEDLYLNPGYKTKFSPPPEVSIL